MPSMGLTTTTSRKPPFHWANKQTKVVGEAIKTLILRRTSRGIGADGKQFKPYDRDYAEEKGTSKVTLRASGKMLNSLTVKVGAKGGTIVSGADYAAFVDAIRPWLALSREDLEELDKVVVAELDAMEKQAGQRREKV